MNENINRKLAAILSEKEAANIKRFAASSEGQRLSRQFSDADKNKLVEEFLKMDTAQLKKKLSTADLSALSGLDAQQILKKLR